MSVRRVILPRVQKNKEQQDAVEVRSYMTYIHSINFGFINERGVHAQAYQTEDRSSTATDVFDTLIDIWEYDVPYITRGTPRVFSLIVLLSLSLS